MKLTPKRTRSDSAKAAVQAHQNAAQAPIEPPVYVTLPDECKPFWDAIVTSRARDTWTESDLVTAANMARVQRALQVVLDALPADRNTLALGSSLQQNLLADIGGLTLNSLSIDNATTTQSSDENTIPLQFQVTSADANTMKDMLTKLERSIRTIDIDSLILERGDTSYRISVSGHAYYAPAKTIQLTEKVVKP